MFRCLVCGTPAEESGRCLLLGCTGIVVDDERHTPKASRWRTVAVGESRVPSVTSENRVTSEVIVILCVLSFLVVALAGASHFFLRKSAIEHGGYVDCANEPHPHDVSECAGAACATAQAVCDPDLFKTLHQRAE